MTDPPTSPTKEAAEWPELSFDSPTFLPDLELAPVDLNLTLSNPSSKTATVSRPAPLPEDGGLPSYVLTATRNGSVSTASRNGSVSRNGTLSSVKSGHGTLSSVKSANGGNANGTTGRNSPAGSTTKTDYNMFVETEDDYLDISNMSVPQKPKQAHTSKTADIASTGKLFSMFSKGGQQSTDGKSDEKEPLEKGNLGRSNVKRGNSLKRVGTGLKRMGTVKRKQIQAYVDAHQRRVKVIGFVIGLLVTFIVILGTIVVVRNKTNLKIFHAADGTGAPGEGEPGFGEIGADGEIGTQGIDGIPGLPGNETLTDDGGSSTDLSATATATGTSTASSSNGSGSTTTTRRTTTTWRAQTTTRAPVQTQRPQSSQPDCIGAQNYYRRQFGHPDLTYSATLEAYACNWARRLINSGQFYHSGGPYGENLFRASGDAGSHMNSCSGAVSSWASERSRYRAGTPISRSMVPYYGHWTQMIWSGSRQVGCCRVGGNGAVVWACEYSPAGNVAGVRAY